MLGKQGDCRLLWFPGGAFGRFYYVFICFRCVWVGCNLPFLGIMFGGALGRRHWKSEASNKKRKLRKHKSFLKTCFKLANPERDNNPSNLICARFNTIWDSEPELKSEKNKKRTSELPTTISPKETEPKHQPKHLSQTSEVSQDLRSDLRLKK